MSLPLLKPRRLTVDEFRELEANAPEDERWELLNGVIYRSMAGGTVRHNDIVQNVSSRLRGELRRIGSPCRTSTENVRLDIPAIGASTLPDVFVNCGPRPGAARTLDDATAVVEVLSPSTSARDRGEKLDAYMTLPGLRTIALIEQDRMHVATYTRTDDGFLRQDLTSPTDRVAFDGLDVSMTLAEIYEDVAFDAA
ncbi:Uma2 family endonuclease [Methylopila sp. 73B]|uniref:Uma2 family endonuclease n=1 Tax=Methylopila sp. 73B TaxID=1120792 RepID=UPI0003764F65|nr:Uma2 family endonuclease [Methylopila sp. 73B]